MVWELTYETGIFLGFAIGTVFGLAMGAVIIQIMLDKLGKKQVNGGGKDD